MPASLTRAEFANSFPGEGHYVEFKQGLSENRVVEAATAFSNADGGVILLGVRPDGTPVGIHNDGEQRARVHRLTRLRDRDILVQHGERGGAQYALSPDLPAPPQSRVFPVIDVAAAIIQLAQAGPVTNEQVREITGADRAAVTRTLTAMVEAGRLVRRGERRATTYTLP